LVGAFADERVMLAALSARQGDLVFALLRSAHLAKLSMAETRHSLATILNDVAALMRLRCGGRCTGGALEQATCLLNGAAAVQRLSAQKDTDLAALVQRLGQEIVPVVLAGRPIAFSSDVQPVGLTPHAAACIGMVLCELVLNAAEHAFPGARGGAIVVRSAVTPDGLHIEVADDGVGVRHGKQEIADRGMGLRMVRQIAGHQLGGRFSIRSGASGQGTVAQLHLPCRLVKHGGRAVCHFAAGEGTPNGAVARLDR